MYEQYLALTDAGVSDVEFTIDADAMCDGLYPDHAASLTVTFAVTTDRRGRVTVTGDGTLSVSMGGLGVSTPELESYSRTAIRIFEAIIPHSPDYYTTSKQFLAAEDPSELDPDHILILSDSVDPHPPTRDE
jgi:hypothetical protein